MIYMTVGELAVKYSLSSPSLPDPEREITGGYTGDLLSWVMSRAKSGDAWVTIMSNVNIIAVASLTDASCVILCDGEKPDKEVVSIANAKGVNVLVSDKPAFELISAISQSI